jgi:hypothetical protein
MRKRTDGLSTRHEKELCPVKQAPIANVELPAIASRGKWMVKQPASLYTGITVVDTSPP